MSSSNDPQRFLLWLTGRDIRIIERSLQALPFDPEFSPTINADVDALIESLNRQLTAQPRLRRK